MYLCSCRVTIFVIVGSTAKQRSTSRPDPDHHSSDPVLTSDSTHSSILRDSDDSDPDKFESVVNPIPKPPCASKLILKEENVQVGAELTSESRFSFSKDDEI